MKDSFGTYKKIAKWPFGNYIFSRLVSFSTPYFTTIHPLIKELRPGYCRIEIKDRRSVRNHIGTVHAIAMCNICEFAMGMAAEASIKPELRWIPRGMTVQYLKKATGTLAGICEIDPSLIVPGDVDFPIEVKDTAGDAVLKATIKLYITEKPKK